MSGLRETERVGCRQILNLMSKSDLLSLSDTVTNKLIVVESTEDVDVNVAHIHIRPIVGFHAKEATETIISFTKNAEEFLRRKKVNRELIFKFLAKEGVFMPPNSEKHQLVKRTLELWSSGKLLTRGQDESDENFSGELTETKSDSKDVKVEVDFEPLVLGQQFCQWFFQLLNSQNPSLGQQPQDWGPQHFWTDVKLHLLSRIGTEQMDEFLGSELVSLRLLALTKEEQLLFSPNLEPRGLRVLASPHGLVLVAVAGTIHRDSACLGIFEQIFGLIRSPLENNSWKIKFINLKIRGQDALGETEVAAPALNYNSSELQLLCS